MSCSNASVARLQPPQLKTYRRLADPVPIPKSAKYSRLLQLKDLGDEFKKAGMDFVWRLQARAAMMWPLFRAGAVFSCSKDIEAS